MPSSEWHADSTLPRDDLTEKRSRPNAGYGDVAPADILSGAAVRSALPANGAGSYHR